MIIVILSVVVAIILFLCSFIGFKEGLRLGMQVSKGIEPPKFKNPIVVVKDIKQKHIEDKEAKKYAESIEQLMNYTGEVEDEE